MADAMNIITGNSLGEGLVVFQIAGGGWSLDIGQAEVLETPGSARRRRSRAPMPTPRRTASSSPTRSR